MLLLRAGEVTEIVENSLLLAAIDTVTYSEIAVPLEDGDRLLLYTDGLIEARNASGRMFGEASLVTAMKESAGFAAGEAAERLIASVQKWAPVQEDDLTVLVCDCSSAQG